MKYTIFSIDNFTDLHTLARFLRLVDEARALGKMKGTMKPMIGSYKGKLKYSFIMRTDDFHLVVADSGYLDKQECIMQVSECNKKYTQLVYPDGEVEYLGCMADTQPFVPRVFEDYSYDPAQDRYFTIVVEGNPEQLAATPQGGYDHVRSD